MLWLVFGKMFMFSGTLSASICSFILLLRHQLIHCMLKISKKKGRCLFNAAFDRLLTLDVMNLTRLSFESLKGFCENRVDEMPLILPTARSVALLMLLKCAGQN